MNKYKHLRAKAREMRQSGATLTEICEQLSLGKTTVYYWIKDLAIPRTGRQTAQLQRASRAMQEKYEKQRRQWYDEAAARAAQLLTDKLLRDFVVLYAAEGYRRDRNQVEFCNSNVDMMRLAHLCLDQLADGCRLHYRLQCHVDNDEQVLKRHWADSLGIEPHGIKIMRKSNAGNLHGRHWRSQYGVLMIQVNSTRLRCQLQAWMDFLAKEWHNSSPAGA
jgi:hypothetical protein